MVTDEVLILLKEIGFEQTQVLSRRPVPGTENEPEAGRTVPEFRSNKVDAATLDRFRERLEEALRGIDINDYASLDTVIATR